MPASVVGVDDEVGLEEVVVRAGGHQFGGLDNGPGEPVWQNLDERPHGGTSRHRHGRQGRKGGEEDQHASCHGTKPIGRVGYS